MFVLKKQESESAARASEARIRFRKLVQKVIMQNRKDKAIKAIAKMEENIRLREAAKAVVASVTGSEVNSEARSVAHSRDSMVNNSRKRGLRYAQHVRTKEVNRTIFDFNEILAVFEIENS